MCVFSDIQVYLIVFYHYQTTTTTNAHPLLYLIHLFTFKSPPPIPTKTATATTTTSIYIPVTVDLFHWSIHSSARCGVISKPISSSLCPPFACLPNLAIFLQIKARLKFATLTSPLSKTHITIFHPLFSPSTKNMFKKKEGHLIAPILIKSCSKATERVNQNKERLVYPLRRRPFLVVLSDHLHP